MTRLATPAAPGLARRLLMLLVGRAQASQIEPSLAELFHVRARRDGKGSARLWYWRQVFGFGLRRRVLNAANAEQIAADMQGGTSHREGSHRGALRPEAWLRDARLAVRSLTRQPGFAALAILTLGLGIGANTAIFSVLHGSLLRPLPYAEPDRLVCLSDGHGDFGGGGANQSVPNLMDLRAGSQLMQSSVIYKIRSGNLTTAEAPERVRILYTSAGLLGLLGLPPQLGRDLAPQDDRYGTEAVAILTDELWRSRFGSDPAIVGKIAVVDARPVLIAGVAPAGFMFPRNPQLLMALQHEGATLIRGNRGHFGLGRLAPGAALEALREELQGIFAGLVEQYPEANEGFFTWAEPLRDYAVARNERSLFLMAGAAALVLLIACVNVANLMLVRAQSRQREFAVRYSLGATRAGLLPLFLSEGIVLALLGGAVGVAAAYWSIDLLVALYGSALPRAEEIELNWTVLGFSLTISLFVGILVGLVPLFRATPGGVHQSLKEGMQGSSARGSRTGRLLVVAEVALAVLLVAGAGLLTNSMWRLQSIDLGVTGADQVLTFSISLPTAKYPTASDVDSFYEQVVQNLERVPGIEAAGLVNRLPLLGADNTSLSVFANPQVEANFVSYRMVTAGYFEATGVELLAGRFLNNTELIDGGRSIVINRTLARQLFGEGTAIGRRINDPMSPPGTPGFAAAGVEVVGVIDDIVGGGAGEPAPPAHYFSFAAAINLLALRPELAANEQIGMSALVRTASDPIAMAEAARAAVRQVDPQVPIFGVRTLADIAVQRLGTRRFAMSLFGVFAGLALLLGAVGIYGVMSYGVAQRSRELGVRMALGANRGSVLRLVLGEGVRLTVPGLAVGLLLALASGQLLSSLLYEVSTLDPLTHSMVAAMLALVCLAASYLPALGATRVDPLTSIRSE